MYPVCHSERNIQFVFLSVKEVYIFSISSVPFEGIHYVWRNKFPGKGDFTCCGNAG